MIANLCEALVRAYRDRGRDLNGELLPGLTRANSYQSPWYARVLGNDDHYQIEYQVPEAAAPWPNAYVRAEASAVEQAIDMVLVAMAQSGGWSIRQ